jgi:hypothetical protein
MFFVNFIFLKHWVRIDKKNHLKIFKENTKKNTKE